MNEIVEDKSNPNWIGLETLVKSLNDKLLKLAEFYFDDLSLTTLRQNRSLLSTATLNVSKACLEVIDSTCVIMATMRSIVKDQSVNIKDDVGLTQNTHAHADTTNNMASETRTHSNKEASMFVRETNSLNPILSLLEVATGEMKNVVNREESSKKEIRKENMKRTAVKKTNEKVKYKHKSKSIGTTTNKVRK